MTRLSRQRKAIFWAGAVAVMGMAGAAFALPTIVHHDESPLRLVAGWPIWLEASGDSVCHQSSGLAYLGRDEKGRRAFLIASDEGALQVCRIKEVEELGPYGVIVEPVELNFVEQQRQERRFDVEAIALDGAPLDWADPDGEFHCLLTTEGRGKRPLAGTRVYAAGIARTADGRWTAQLREKELPGWTREYLLRLVGSNTGFEGLAATPRFLFLGLESIDDPRTPSSRGTALYLVDRETGEVAEFLTRPLGIGTICGLVAANDSVIVGIDRNGMSVFALIWDRHERGLLRACHTFPLEIIGPQDVLFGVPSLESIAIDETGDLWLTLDPWLEHYRALCAVDSVTASRFARGVSMLFRYAGAPLWEALSGPRRGKPN